MKNSLRFNNQHEKSDNNLIRWNITEQQETLWGHAVSVSGPVYSFYEIIHPNLLEFVKTVVTKYAIKGNCIYWRSISQFISNLIIKLTLSFLVKDILNLKSQTAEKASTNA